MNASRLLPADIRDRIAGMPEYRHGVNRVVVSLKDGSEFRDVYVAWATEVIRVGDSEVVPFDPADVVNVRNQA